MKKKKVLIISGIIVIVLAAAVILLINVMPMLLMKPAETGYIGETGILAVKNARNNIFFIETSDGYIMVDAGSDADAVRESVQEFDIGIPDVRHILLTHSDYDHVAALSLFPEAVIYMSEDELQMVNGQTKRNLTGGNSFPEGTDYNSAILLTDGQELNLGGNTVKCVKTPGHTEGSVSFVLNGEYLFTGDSFRVSGNTAKIHPFSMDRNKSEGSIKILGETAEGTKYTFTGHYGYYESDTLEFE